MFERWMLILALLFSGMTHNMQTGSTADESQTRMNFALPEDFSASRPQPKSTDLVFAGKTDFKKSEPKAEKEAPKKTAVPDHEHTWEKEITDETVEAVRHTERVKVSDAYTDDGTAATSELAIKCPICDENMAQAEETERIAHLKEHLFSGSDLNTVQNCSVCKTEVAEADMLDHAKQHYANDLAFKEEEVITNPGSAPKQHDAVYKTVTRTDVPAKIIHRVTGFHCTCGETMSREEYEAKYGPVTDEEETITASISEKLEGLTIPDFSTAWYWDKAHNNFPTGLCTWYVTGVLNQVYGDKVPEGGFLDLGYSRVIVDKLCERYPNLFEYGAPGTIPKAGAVFSTVGGPNTPVQFHTGFVIAVNGDQVTYFDGNHNNQEDDWNTAISPAEWGIQTMSAQKMYEYLGCCFANPID